MSGIGELAYTVLLGWMRALVDWFWALVSGRSGTDGWQWFLSNWKVWLIVLIVGGLVIDWLMWVVRWRPYRLLLGRFGRAPAKDASGEAAWDSGTGYYAMEMPADGEPGDWTEATFATLSELDPDWAGDVVIDTDPDLYDPEFMPSTHYGSGYEEAPAYVQDVAKSGFWDEEAEEAAQISQAQPEAYYEAPAPQVESLTYEDEYEEPAYEEDLPQADEDDTLDSFTIPSSGFDPYAPYDAYDVQEAAAYAAEQDATPPSQDTAPQMYGRPGLWPGQQFPFANEAVRPAEETPQPEADPYDPLFNPEGVQAENAPRRRRRHLHASDPTSWQPEDPVQETPAQGGYATDYDSAFENVSPVHDLWEDQRPERLVTPESQYPAPEPKGRKGKRGRKEKNELRTVTGKPVARRGLLRFASTDDEAISGLPPLDLTDPFLPAVKPGDPDFEPEDEDDI